MKTMMRVLNILVLLLCSTILFMPLTAQENGGGTIVYGRTISEPFEFSSSEMFCKTNECHIPVEAMYISLLGIDPEIGWYAPNQQRALASGWEFSNGNRVLTLYLRDDLSWSDGTPITAEDVMMSYELGLHPETSIDGDFSVRHFNTTIENVEVPDEHTIRITFAQGRCQALQDVAAYWKVIPAHIYRQLLDEVGYEGLPTHKWFQHPTVVSGPFHFEELSDDNSVTLLPNENYHDNALGYVSPERFKQVPITPADMTVEAFLSGEVNVLSSIATEQRQAFLDAATAGALQIYQYPEISIAFLALNQADPNNPQPALDDNGQRIDQGLHPIFGDRLVRQAIAHAIDVDRLIEETTDGFATRIATHVVPNSWAYNPNLLPRSYDPQLALALLAEAGWIPENPDLPVSPDNRLICRDCLYAREVDPQFNGSYMEFELLKHDRRPHEIEMMGEQLTRIGITVHLEAVEFRDAVDRLNQETYDATLIGLILAYPYDPTTNDIFGAISDAPGSGFNITSFYNEAYFALEATASSVPGCGLTERANIYRQMQEIIYVEQPFIFLFTSNGMYAARNEVEGFDPYPNNLFWNVDTWVVREDN